MSGQLRSQQADKEPSTVQTLGKGGKKRSSQGAQANTQPQPGTSSNPFPRNTSTGRPQVHCSACGGNDHLRKDCQEDNYCTKCRSESHASSMCCTPVKQSKNNNICIYCGSKNHTFSNCTNRPNDNKEEPSSTPRDIQSHGFKNTGNIANAGQQVNRFPYQDYRYDMKIGMVINKSGLTKDIIIIDIIHQITIIHQPSPLGSIPGQDLSSTLIDLANIRSRSLEIMVANQKSQQDVFSELARSNKDKANDAMFSTIKVYDGTNRGLCSKNGSMSWTKPVESAAETP